MSDATQIPTLDDVYQAKKDVEDIHEFTTSTSLSFTDSEGRRRKTIDGVVVETAETMGWFVQGNFSSGFTFTARNQVGRDIYGELWSYNGVTLPFVVSVGTVPSQPNYTNRGDAALRSDLAKSKGASIVKTASGESVQKVLDDLPAVVVAQANRAEDAAEVAMSAGWVYGNILDGEAARTDGEYFWVVSGTEVNILDLYSMGETISTFTGKSTPSRTFFNGIVRFNALKLPAICDANGVELIGFNIDGSAVFKVSQEVLNQVLNQLDPYFASQLEINGIAQSPYSAAPGIFTSDFIELLGFKLDGSAVFKVSQEVADQVKSLISYAPYDPIGNGLLPKTDITVWGDSMVQGAGGSGTSITTVLSTELSRTVNNRGIGGQDTLAVAIRQGGSNLLVTLTANEIPASGGVAITAKNSNILSSGGAFTGTVAVTIAGIAGIISTNGTGNWTFTRSSAGSVVAVPANSVAEITGGTSFIPNPEINRNNTMIVWSGRNGVVTLGRTAAIACRDNIINMVDHLSPLCKRVLVTSVCNGRRLRVSDGTGYEGSGTSRYNDVIALNKELAETFKESFIDLRYYMVNHAIYDAGLTPTATDLLDMAADCIPTSLMADDVHFNSIGYTMAGKYQTRQIKARGW